MDNIIKGIHLLKDVSAKDVIKLEDAALDHYRKAFLSFKVSKIEEKNVVINIKQGKEAGEYLKLKEMITIVHDTFDKYLPGKKVLVHANPYKVAPIDQVSVDWIAKKMLEGGITLKQMTEDTGLNNTFLSTLINGGKPLSQVTRAMFYFYFKSVK